MRNIPVFRYNLEPFDSIAIPDDIVEQLRPILLDPAVSARSSMRKSKSDHIPVKWSVAL